MSGHSSPCPPPTTSSSVSGCQLRGGCAGHSGQPGCPYAPSRQHHFEGEMEALKGHIYNLIGSKSANLFITLTKQITGFVGWTYTQGGDIHRTWHYPPCRDPPHPPVQTHWLWQYSVRKSKNLSNAQKIRRKCTTTVGTTMGPGIRCCTHQIGGMARSPGHDTIPTRNG